ncbi:hypothetical protein CGRA01v4_11360 [Colletotrichum graminicola]|nr:hypothetical protein CGRA01v4_11360 [Colletotrichum graminicola]
MLLAHNSNFGAIVMHLVYFWNQKLYKGEYLSRKRLAGRILPGVELLQRASQDGFAYVYPLRAVDGRCRSFGCYHWLPRLPDGELLLDDSTTHALARPNQKRLGHAASSRLSPDQPHNDSLAGSTVRCGPRPHKPLPLTKDTTFIAYLESSNSTNSSGYAAKGRIQPCATPLVFTLGSKSLAQYEISATRADSTEMSALTHAASHRNVDVAHGFCVFHASFAKNRLTLAISRPAGAAAS